MKHVEVLVKISELALLILGDLDPDRHTSPGEPHPTGCPKSHFPIASTPSVGSELQSEHFVPLRHAGATLEAVRAHAPRLLTLLHVSELRTIAGDGLWLSPTQGEDVLCIAFTWKKVPGAVAELLVDIERSLTTFSARPHWGKLSSLDRDAISDLYPRLPEFCRLVTEFDPDRKFASPFSERVLDI
ncbi:hypothetical protein FHX72_000867 [Pseudoclavibacter helvolus]|uniref:D-arabinono-1,4-lactone oxidase C-terminal domain-containing protein n=1 Tax=Pseudoclavibacter helvolus TaxID=255205 RepID=A0A7W4ULN3_9MICO|nr:hypothetical protein [Pseudoclavibacter helvolus]